MQQNKDDIKGLIHGGVEFYESMRDDMLDDSFLSSVCVIVKIDDNGKFTVVTRTTNSLESLALLEMAIADIREGMRNCDGK